MAQFSYTLTWKPVQNEIAALALRLMQSHRHPLAYYSIKLLTKMLGGSRLVQSDAPLSVARAFSRADWQRLLAQVGITEYELC